MSSPTSPAFVVGEPLGTSSVRLETGAGVVALQLRREGGRVVYGTMQQPLPAMRRSEPEAELLAALRLTCSGLPIACYRNGPTHVFVALESEDAVSAVRLDLSALAAVGEYGVSCFAGAGRKWKTRMFAPALGVAEDPATGSAAGQIPSDLWRLLPHRPAAPRRSSRSCSDRGPHWPR